jgi:hypothetical protein
MNTIRGCNAKLHGMEKVEPEHIAYAFILVCALINFNDYLTNVVEPIQYRRTRQVARN